MHHSDDASPSVLSRDLPTGVFLLDVREDDEWAAGHAPDAVHIPVWPAIHHPGWPAADLGDVRVRAGLAHHRAARHRPAGHAVGHVDDVQAAGRQRLGRVG